MRRLTVVVAVLALAVTAACGGNDDDEGKAAFDEAFALYNAGQWAQAILAFDGVIEGDPESARAYAFRGVSRWNLGHDSGDNQQIQQAITDFDRAVELDRSLFLAHLYLGRAFYDLGRHADAVSQYEIAMSMADNPASQLELVYYRGIALRDLGDIDGARDALESASQLAQAGELRDLIKEALESLDAAN